MATPYLARDGGEAARLVSAFRTVAARLLERTRLGKARWLAPNPLIRRSGPRGPRHPVHEWFLAAAGTTRFSCPDGEHRLEAGHTLVVPAGMPHREAAEPAGSAVQTCLVIPDPAGIHLLDVGAVHGHITGGKRLFWIHPRAHLLAPRLDAWVAAVHRDGPATVDEASGLALACAALLVDILAGGSAERAPLPPVVRRVVALIRTRFDDPGLGDDDFAQAAGHHPDWLRVIFRRATGQTPRQALLEHRMTEACALLADPRHGQREVARAIGFTTASHFSHQFHRRFGLTPTAWRQTRGGLRL